jgi:hypothetical protein
MEGVRGILLAIARIAGCNLASLGESPKWTLNRPKHGGYQEESPQFRKGKQLYSALYGVHTEVLHDLTAVLNESAAESGTVKTSITAPPSIEEFREQRRRKRKPTDNADKRAKKPTTSTKGVSDVNCCRSLKFPPGTSSSH